MTTTITTRTAEEYARTRTSLRRGLSVTRAKTTTSKPLPKPPIPIPIPETGARKKDRPGTQPIEVIFEGQGGDAELAPRLVSASETPTSSPGPVTPSTPLVETISPKNSRSSLRPPSTQHSARDTGQNLHHGYTRSLELNANHGSPKTAASDSRNLGSRSDPALKHSAADFLDRSAQDPIRDLKSLQRYGVRFVQPTDDMRGTQVLAQDAMFAAEVEFLSKPWSDLKTGSGTQSRILAHAYQLRCDLEDYYIRRVPNTTHKLVFAFLQDLAPPCAVAEKVKLSPDEKRGQKAYHIGLLNEEVMVFGDSLPLAVLLSEADVPEVAFDRRSNCQLPFLFVEVGQGIGTTEEACVRLAQRMLSGLATYAGLYAGAHARAGYQQERLYRRDVAQTTYGLLVLGGLRWSVWALAEDDDDGYTLVKLWETNNVTKPEQMARVVSILRHISWQARPRRNLVVQWLEGIYGHSMPTPAGKTPPPPEGDLPALMTPLPPSPPSVLQDIPAEDPLLRSRPPSPSSFSMPFRPADVLDPLRDNSLARKTEAPPLGPRRHSDGLLPLLPNMYSGPPSAPSAYYPPAHYALGPRPVAPVSTGYSGRSVHAMLPPPMMPAMALATPPSPNLRAFPLYGPSAGSMRTANLARNYTGGSLRQTAYYDEPLERQARSRENSQKGRSRTISQPRPREVREKSMRPMSFFDKSLDRQARPRERFQRDKPRIGTQTPGRDLRQKLQQPKHRRSASAGAVLNPDPARKGRRDSPPMVGKKATPAPSPNIISKGWKMFTRK